MIREKLIRFVPYKVRFLLGVFIWGLLECRWSGEGFQAMMAYAWNFLRALSSLARRDFSTPRFYSARWKNVRDLDVLRRNICEFVTRVCHEAPRPYGDTRFSLGLLVRGALTGKNPFVEFELRDLPRLKREIMEEWFPQGLGDWEGEDFEAILFPVGALLHDVPLRPIPEYPGGAIPERPC